MGFCVISRDPEESIFIHVPPSENPVVIRVKVFRIKGGHVRLGVDAPKDCDIERDGAMSRKATIRMTDYAEEVGGRDCDKCDYCGKLYNPDYEGHTDEATGLSFCDAPCEMHYDEEIGLPKGYVYA